MLSSPWIWSVLSDKFSKSAGGSVGIRPLVIFLEFKRCGRYENPVGKTQHLEDAVHVKMNQHLEFCTAHTNRITSHRLVFNRRWGRKWVDTERSRKFHGPNGYRVLPAVADFGLLYRSTQLGILDGHLRFTQDQDEVCRYNYQLLSVVSETVTKRLLLKVLYVRYFVTAAIENRLIPRSGAKRTCWI